MATKAESETINIHSSIFNIHYRLRRVGSYGSKTYRGVYLRLYIGAYKKGGMASAALVMQEVNVTELLLIGHQ